MKPRSAFIQPSAPVLRPSPPTGPFWIHEAKMDGWRLQLHATGGSAILYSRNGADLTKRFPAIRDSLTALRCRAVIIDAELVASDANDRPDFSLLMGKNPSNLCCWCFDLLSLNGRDLRDEPLVKRRARLQTLLLAADSALLRFSEDFPDPHKLLAAAEKAGLEGIVSKKKDQPYRSGKNPGWIKVKSESWKRANKNRWELFQR